MCVPRTLTGSILDGSRRRLPVSQDSRQWHADVEDNSHGSESLSVRNSSFIDRHKPNESDGSRLSERRGVISLPSRYVRNAFIRVSPLSHEAPVGTVAHKFENGSSNQVTPMGTLSEATGKLLRGYAEDFAQCVCCPPSLIRLESVAEFASAGRPSVNHDAVRTSPGGDYDAGRNP
jgi:hypothetical protein